MVSGVHQACTAARAQSGRRSLSTLRRVALAAALTLPLGWAVAPPAHANGYGEDSSWQFDTSADKANKALVEDMILRKKGGYYNSFGSTYNTTNNTTIEHQTNCNVSATAAGNSGSNGQDGSASSPNITNTSGITTTSTGNTSGNGLSADGPSGVVYEPNGEPVPVGTVSNNQSNTGTQTSSVNGSSSGSSSGTVSSGGGTNSQVLNSDQSNTAPQSATVTGSTACSLAAGAPLN